MALEIGDRAIALIDILGFEELVLTSDLCALAGALETAFVMNTQMAAVHGEFDVADSETGSRVVWPEPHCAHFEFSDTILLYSVDSSASGCRDVIVSTWFFLRSMFGARFPCRGTISFGALAVDREERFFVGPSIIEAYHLARAQNWGGALVSPSVEEAFPEIRSAAQDPTDAISSLLLPYPVPFKADPPSVRGRAVDTDREYLCINWRFNLVVKDGTRSLFREPRDSDARVKIENTLRFCSVVRKLGKHWADDPKLPLEKQRHVVGFMTPPLVHGDEY
ncbi:MAG: hypothetical protein Q8Q12_18425 [bacterium]|nr:hypothetical protein [bacterium]